MQNTINMQSVFSDLDSRRAAAQAIIARNEPEAVEEASRVALIYNRCHPTSLKHLEEVVRILAERA